MPKGAVPFPFGKCGVCNDQATGVHYGAETCEGCKGFFKRSLFKAEKYSCTTNGNCSIGPDNRIKCKFCRFQRCVAIGMSMEAIKMGRIPKSEKQKALFNTSFSSYRAPSERMDIKISPDSNNVPMSAPSEFPFQNRTMQPQTPKVERAISHNSFSQVHPNSESLSPQPKIRKANSLELILPDEEMVPVTSHPNQFNPQYHQKRTWIQSEQANVSRMSTDPSSHSSDESHLSPGSMLQCELGRLVNTTMTIRDSPPDSVQTPHQNDMTRNGTFYYPHENPHPSKYSGTGGDLLSNFPVPNHSLSRPPPQHRQNSLDCHSNSGQNLVHPKFEVRLSWPVTDRSNNILPNQTSPAHHSAMPQPADLLTCNNNPKPLEVVRTRYTHTEPNQVFNRKNVEMNRQPDQRYPANIYRNPNPSIDEPESDYNSIEGSVTHSPVEPNQNGNGDSVLNDENLIQELANSYRNCTKTGQRGIEVMNKILLGEIEMHTKTLPFCKENMTLLWSWLMESVTAYNKHMMNFVKTCPHVKLISTEDQIALIKHGYLSLWLIWNAPLFHNGETYIPFENNFVYTRAWMENILPPDFVQFLYDYTERQNRHNFTIDELALLSLLAVTPTDVCGLQRPDLIRNIHRKYRTILEQQFKRTRVNFAKFVKEIDPMLDTLSIARKRQEIILNFSPDQPPEIDFSNVHNQ